MKIIGPDRLVLAGKGDAAAAKFITDYGLKRVDAAGLEPGSVERYEAADGTSIDLVAADDPAHPDTLGTGNALRRSVYGIADMASLDAIADELGKDQPIVRRADGSFDAMDPLGFALAFQLTCRRPIAMAAEAINVPGAAPQRPVNMVALADSFVPQPRSLSHFALFVPDLAVAEAFYIGRLQFRLSDRLGEGPFLRPAGTLEHHTMFLIKTPPFMKGLEHLTFHFGGPTDVVRGGKHMLNLGYEQFWGPGRHQMGGNWFWYFKSPLGVNFEFDADMDLHDDNWVPRYAPLHVDNAQLFLFEPRDNWAPFAAPAGARPAEAH
jgi:catechol 2,3-dioxygenase-like lactoylglutathione lyase family enzyme